MVSCTKEEKVEKNINKEGKKEKILTLRRDTLMNKINFQLGIATAHSIT